MKPLERAHTSQAGQDINSISTIATQEHQQTQQQQPSTRITVQSSKHANTQILCCCFSSHSAHDDVLCFDIDSDRSSHHSDSNTATQAQTEEKIDRTNANMQSASHSNNNSSSSNHNSCRYECHLVALLLDPTRSAQQQQQQRAMTQQQQRPRHSPSHALCS